MKSYFAFQWHITDECDQRCKHCYIFSENACKKLDSMTWEQMQKALENCLDFCRAYGRLPYFYITGSRAETRSCTRTSGACWSGCTSCGSRSRS